jgi:Rod binding domain-containing protein
METSTATTLGVANLVAQAKSPLMQASKAQMSLDKIKLVSEDFESVFLSNMLEEMFAGVGEDDPFGNSEGAEAWRSIRTEEFARVIARSGGIGLAEHVQRHLIALQEKQP